MKVTFGQPIIWRVSLSPEAVRGRLAPVLKDPFLAALRGGGIVGRFWWGGNSFYMRRQIPLINNSFSSYLRGRLTPIAGGTEIRATVGMHPAVTAFMGFWLAFVSLFLVVGLFHTAQAGFSLLVPVVMLAFAGCLVAFGRRLGGGDRVLIEFLDSVLAESVYYRDG